MEIMEDLDMEIMEDLDIKNMPSQREFSFIFPNKIRKIDKILKVVFSFLEFLIKDGNFL